MTTASAPLQPESPLPHRGLQGFFGAVLAGVISGVLAIIAMTIGINIPFFAGIILLVPIPLFLTGFGIGRGDVIVAAVVCAAVIMFGLGHEIMQMILVVFVLPAVIISLLALRYRYDDHGALYWYPTGRLLTIIVLYPLFAFALFSFLVGQGDLEGWIRGLVTMMIEAPAQAGINGIGAELLKNPEIKAAAIANATPIFAGMTITSWILFIITGALWAQYALSNNKLALRPMPHWSELELPPWLLVLFAIMGLLGLFFQGSIAFFARNTLLPLSLPYFFVGIALMHVWAGQRKHKLSWLVAFYVLVSLGGYLAIIVAVVGVLEPWLHLRAKIAARKK